MKITKRTLKVLENYVTINSSILINKTPEGASCTTIRTIDRQGGVYAEAVVDEVFGENICFLDLKSVLALLSSFPDSDLDFADTQLTISSEGSKAVIPYTDPEYIIRPQKAFPADEPDFTFNLPQDKLDSVLSTGNLLRLPHLRVFTRDGSIFLQACDKTGKDKSTFDVLLGDAVNTFDLYIMRDNLRMIVGDYTVGVKSGQYAKFTHADESDIFYCIALDIT